MIKSKYSIKIKYIQRELTFETADLFSRGFRQVIKLKYYLKIKYIQHKLAFEVVDLFSRGFQDFMARRARLAPAAARG